ncbi:SpoIIE family protein phosphatase [Streptomyces griseorubiginosus]|uniref:SpoIIE family protein phosphatase n=1 Tax=Streptomyces griseorubiginosus TaxID=67304 RepID=UPI0036E2AD20
MGAIPAQRESVAHGADTHAPAPVRVRATFPGTPLTPGAARALLRTTLSEWVELALPGTEFLTPRQSDDAVVVVSELVTNAVVHAGTEVELDGRLEAHTGALVIEVLDHHPSRAPRDGDTETPYGIPEYGRGLRLVAALAESWGITYRTGAKTVWARLPAGGKEALEGIQAYAGEYGDGDGDGDGGEYERGTPGSASAPGLPGLLAPVPQARTRVEQDRDWLNRGALSFLAEASDLLAGQLDENLVAALAGQLIVPRLADWCAVWLEDEVAGRWGSPRPGEAEGGGGGRGDGGASGPRLARVWHASETRIEELRRALEKEPPQLPGGQDGTGPVPFPWPTEALGGADSRFGREHGSGSGPGSDAGRASGFECGSASGAEYGSGSTPAVGHGSGAGSGFECGSASGAEYGSGSTPAAGHGSGAGSGFECGSASGAEYGSGSTPAAGHGSGHGQGHGSGSGSGHGQGSGSGSGFGHGSAGDIAPAPAPGDRPAPGAQPLPDTPPGSALAYRLTAGGRPLGTLVIGRAGVGSLPDEITGLVEDLSRRVALAIGAARQYARQATISAVLQRGLLPGAVAEIPGVRSALVYEPCDKGGPSGDFYDLFPAGDGRWCFAVGDVQGKGPEAAVVIGLARPWLRLLAREGYRVADVLDRLNQLLLDDATEAADAAARALASAGGRPPHPGDGPQTRFLSLLYGELVPFEGGVRCTLAAAGHPLPLLLGSHGEVRTVARPQTLLGVVEDETYTSETFELRPGDSLLCVTDGVTERRSGSRQFDDEDGLAEALAGCSGLDAELIAERIRRLVHEFGARPPEDDLALLVLQAE